MSLPLRLLVNSGRAKPHLATMIPNPNMAGAHLLFLAHDPSLSLPICPPQAALVDSDDEDRLDQIWRVNPWQQARHKVLAER